jgi:hypothetical protein
MNTTMDDFDSRLPSGRLWKGFAPPMSMGPYGSGFQEGSGNPSFGFFDHFFATPTTTLLSPYLKLIGTGCTVEQIVSTSTEKGIMQLALDGNADNDEVVLQWGRGIEAPFQLADKDLVFECRLAVSAITAAKWDIGVGLGEVGMGATDVFFADTSGLADRNFLGFVKLAAEGAAWDGAYKADGQTYQNGATKTKLDTLHTAVAATYVKLGFRYRAHPKTVEFYVNGVMPGGTIAPARLTASEIDAATFPDDVLLAPIIGAKDQAGDTALTVKVDWWGCAQML